MQGFIFVEAILLEFEMDPIRHDVMNTAVRSGTRRYENEYANTGHR